MKVAIVRLSALRRYGRWDAGFYLGRTRDLEENTERAEKRAARAQKLAQEAREALEKGEERHRRMIAEGGVEPL